MIYTPIDTPQAVKSAIDNFCKANERWLPDYSFAHIALGDYNLSNGHIDFCLQYDQILPWFYEFVRNEALIFDKDIAINSGIEAVQEISDFLRHLKTIPEPIREGVADLND
jgi:hypothetical protein